MKARIIAIVAIVALMLILTLCYANRDGVGLFVVNGILAGIAMAIAVTLDKEIVARREARKKAEREKRSK